MNRVQQREGLRLMHFGTTLAECESLDDTPYVGFQDREARDTITYFAGPHPSFPDRWLPASSGPSLSRRVARNLARSAGFRP